MKPNEHCLAWDWKTGPVVALFLGDNFDPQRPYLPVRFRVARLTGESFEALGIAPLPPKIAILSDHWNRKPAEQPQQETV